MGGGGALAQGLEVGTEDVALFVHDCLQLVYYHLELLDLLLLVVRVLYHFSYVLTIHMLKTKLLTWIREKMVIVQRKM